MAGLKPIFKIQTPDLSGQMLIILQLYYKNKRIRISTGLKIKPEYWCSDSERPTTNRKLLRNASHLLLKELEYISVRLDETEYYVNNLVLDLKQQKKLSLEAIKENLQEFFDRKKEESERELTIPEYYDGLIKRMEEGSIHTDKGTLYTPGTIKAHKVCRNQIAAFEEVWGDLFFSSVSNDFYNKFISYCNTKGYRQNTIGRAIKSIKFVMRMGLKENVHTNEIFKSDDFRAVIEDVDNIYLTTDELKRLYELELTGKDEIYRDIFLIGCYTAQRFSDYSRIIPEYIKTLSDGTRVIDMVTKKTRERVIIPFLFPQLDTILKKYGYKLPKIYEQDLNENIKKIGKQAEISETVVLTEIIGGKRVESTHKKHDLIKTHTARRTGATNMFKMGYAPLEIMKVTGHTSESTFMKYIKVSKEENAKIMTDKKR